MLMSRRIATASSTDVPPNFNTTTSSLLSNLLCRSSPARSPVLCPLMSSSVSHSSVLGAFFVQKKNPPPDRFWRWVRVILLRVLTSSDSVLQKTRSNSCRHACACRCNSRVLLDEVRHENNRSNQQQPQNKGTRQRPLGEIQNSD